MTNIEYATKELKKNSYDLDLGGALCHIAYFVKQNGKSCAYEPCHKCDFQDERDAADYLLAQHKGE